MTTETAKVTIEQIAQIVGTTPDRIQLAGDEGDKWLRADQVGSRGIMNSWVTRLKEAGIPAFFRQIRHARKPARRGRPPRADRAQVRARINVTLPRDVADYLTELGDGNRSQAIVELARASAMARDSAIPVLPADQNAGV